MSADRLAEMIQSNLRHEPTPQQRQAMLEFAAFITNRDDHTLMIMRGCAGTGKTTLAAAIVRTMVQLKQRIILLAPTGRAAKVLSLNAGLPAYTIHRRIYRQKSIDQGLSGFTLNVNTGRDTLFVVDEASMIANSGYGDSAFGSGRLLDDLMQFVYGGANCRLMLIGDKAQLPPVGEEESPALMRQVMETYGMTVYEADLTEVLRQSEHSGILYNATMIRRLITHDEVTQLPKIVISAFADIHVVRGDELIEQLASSYSKVGIDDTIVVTRSNKRANIYNHGIRNMILGREEQLCSSDMLMVVKNNYHWTEHDKESPLPFIANGDRAKVVRVRNRRQLYGFSFVDITIAFIDFDDYEMTVTAMLDSLSSDAPSLTKEQHEALFNAVMEDYADVSPKSERLKKLKEDIYYNALQIKYAYAVTCHKAQGGQWSHVYIDQGYMSDDMLTPDYIHWLYTAFTRTTDQLYLVNWPKEQTT